jgi:hypothetical protein
MLYLYSNPGQVFTNELTSTELQLVQNLDGITYSRGDILYHNGTEFVRLGIGSDDQVIKAVSGLPSWQNESGGGGGSGDMAKAVYDTDDNGIVDEAESITNQGYLATLDTVDTAQIEDKAVTLAKIQDVATDIFLGRTTVGTGVVEELSATDARSILNVADGATSNSSDVILLDRANHTGTQTASTISDFQTTVSSNTDVSANTAARHTHANQAILDATTASYTSAEASKLAAIEAGAQVNDVDSVNGQIGIVVLDTSDIDSVSFGNTVEQFIIETEGRVSDLETGKSDVGHTHNDGELDISGTSTNYTTTGNTIGEHIVGIDEEIGNIYTALSAGSAPYVTTISSTVTITETSGDNIYKVDCTSGNITITLPTAVSNTAKYTFEKIDSSANTLTVDADGTETINGVTTKVIGVRYKSFTIVSDNSNWVDISTKVFGKHTLISEDTGNNTLSISHTATEQGFVYGWIYHSNADTYCYYTPVGGSQIEMLISESSVASNKLFFCIPVIIGDVVLLQSSDGNGGMYFKSFN